MDTIDIASITISELRAVTGANEWARGHHHRVYIGDIYYCVTRKKFFEKSGDIADVESYEDVLLDIREQRSAVIEYKNIKDFASSVWDQTKDTSAKHIFSYRIEEIEKMFGYVVLYKKGLEIAKINKTSDQESFEFKLNRELKDLEKAMNQLKELAIELGVKLIENEVKIEETEYKEEDKKEHTIEDTIKEIESHGGVRSKYYKISTLGGVPLGTYSGLHWADASEEEAYCDSKLDTVNKIIETIFPEHLKEEWSDVKKYKFEEVGRWDIDFTSDDAIKRHAREYAKRTA